MQPLQFTCHPAGFFFLRGQLHNTNLLALRFVGAQHFLREVRGHGVLRDYLGGHAQDIWSRTKVVCQRDAEFSGVAAFAPAGKAFEKEFEAAERSAAEAVNRLVVVTHGENVFRFASQQFQQTQLRDVGVLELVHEDVAVSLLQGTAQLIVLLEQFHSAGNQRAERNSLLFF